MATKLEGGGLGLCDWATKKRPIFLRLPSADWRKCKSGKYLTWIATQVLIFKNFVSSFLIFVYANILGASEVSTSLYCNSRTSVLGR